MRHKFRYYKITPKDEERIKKLSKKFTHTEIAKRFNVSYRTIKYHLLSKKERKERIRLNGLRQKKRKGKIKKIPKEYIKNYLRERLKKDKEFNKRFKRNVEKARIKRIKERRKKGLCICGRKRKDKRWLMCEKCRKERRKK